MISLFLIVLVQIALVSPFIFDPAAKILGWRLGANTSVIDYLQFTKIITKPG